MKELLWSFTDSFQMKEIKKYKVLPRRLKITGLKEYFVIAMSMT